MTTTAKKSKESRVSEVSALLARLSDKDLSAVESMVKSRQPQDDLDAILASPEGQELVKSLKTLKATKIYFDLSQLKSLDRKVSLGWDVESDLEYTPRIELDNGSKKRHWNENIADELICILEDGARRAESSGNPEVLDDLLPTKIRQELAKDRARVESAIKALETKKLSFGLKDIPDLHLGVVCLSFDGLDPDYNEDRFNPELSWKSKKKPESILASLLDYLIDNIEGLETDLPEEIASKIRAANTLGEKIFELAGSLADKHTGWTRSDLIDEANSA